MILNFAKPFADTEDHQELTLLIFWTNGESLKWFSNFYLSKQWEKNNVDK